MSALPLNPLRSGLPLAAAILVLAALAGPAPVRAAPPALEACPAREVAVREELAHNLESRLTSLGQGPFALRLPEEEVTSLLALRGGPLGLRSARVIFEPGLVCLQARWLGFLPLEAGLRLAASSQQRLSAEVAWLRLAGRPLPGPLRALLGRVLEDTLGQAPGMSLHALEVRPGEMHVSGQVGPRP